MQMQKLVLGVEAMMRWSWSSAEPGFAHYLITRPTESSGSISETLQRISSTPELSKKTNKDEEKVGDTETSETVTAKPMRGDSLMKSTREKVFPLSCPESMLHMIMIRRSTLFVHWHSLESYFSVPISMSYLPLYPVIEP